MRKQRRNRKTINQDRKSGHEMMAEKDPAASAARQMKHKPYTVDDYLKKLGFDVKERVDAE